MSQRARPHSSTAAPLLRAVHWAVRLCVCASVPAVPACGRAEWHQADERLNFAAQAAREDGFVPMRGPHNTFATFSDSGTTTWRVQLEPHQAYFITAACAPACGSLDFTIAESDSGATVADTSAGPAPRLVYTPERGSLVLRFRHGPCASGRCRWIAQVYERRTAPPQ